MIPLFTKKLLQWNRKDNTRSMPWKGEKDPYKIWLSEIILQQTRVEQGWEYYEKFIMAFPTIGHLARAPGKKVFKLWEGLGYYTRCRNLMETARIIFQKYAGCFPTTYEQIAVLKGVGPYTAAAIASFAFDLPHAVVDGNVQRVLARYFGISTPIDTSGGKKFYFELANRLLDKEWPGIYNQAIMDFGSVICKPKNPLCENCVQRKECVAFRHSWIKLLPVKEKRIQRKTRWFYYFIIQTNEKKIYIRQRTEKDIWKGLYEFVLWEPDQSIPPEEIAVSEFLRKFFAKHSFTLTGISGLHQQQLTHQNIKGRFITIQINKPISKMREYELISPRKIKAHPFPKFITKYLLNLH